MRNGLLPFLERIAGIAGIEDLNLTTNGVLTFPHVKDLRSLGVRSVNLSLDTLDRERFRMITRRDELPAVLKTFYQLLDSGIEVKLNMVVMEGQNTQDILPMAGLTRDYPVSVRFIEEMPFNGEGVRFRQFNWNYRRILEELTAQYPAIHKMADEPNATAYRYGVPGHKGTIGIIAAYSRSFCGTCNRIRITAQGTLKTCLYDDGVLDLRQLLREGTSYEQLEEAFRTAFRSRAKDGFEAEGQRLSYGPVTESMSTIGG